MKDDLVEPRPTPATLRIELERSRDEVAAGRLAPLRGVLTAMHGRATRRMNHKRRTGVDTSAADTSAEAG